MKGTTLSQEQFKSKDDNIDDIYNDIYGRIVSIVHENPKSFDDAILFLMIAQTLERIGDIACKMANRIIYIVEGKRVWLR